MAVLLCLFSTGCVRMNQDDLEIIHVIFQRKPWETNETPILATLKL